MILNILIGIFVFIIGLCIGSFLNCFIYRLEHKKKMTGRSFCPKCKHDLCWKDLFPVFSFLFLNGKCRYCKKKISVQYPLVELVTGFLFVLIFLFFYQQATPNQLIYILFLFYIFSALVVTFVYDLKHYIIPDKVLFPAIIISLAYYLIPPYDFHHIVYGLLAAVVASGFFLAIFLFSAGKWMGFGDVKLAVLMGLLLGLPNVLVALFLAFFFGAIIGLILMVVQKKSLKSEIPFGPFLIIGTFLALLYGVQIVQWYSRFFIV
jgi:prepilin signal peptidase PulO-like enzyme (type II secretory pathway)